MESKKSNSIRFLRMISGHLTIYENVSCSYFILQFMIFYLRIIYSECKEDKLFLFK